MTEERPTYSSDIFWTEERRLKYQQARHELRDKLRPYCQAIREAERLTADNLSRRVTC